MPAPGAILESLCSWNAGWKQDLAESAGLPFEHVEKLLKNDLPITPSLARRLELFTGAPAHYWEHLWRLYDEYRMEADATLVVQLGEITHARKMAARAAAPAPATDEAGLTGLDTRRGQRRALDIVVDDDPTTIEEAPLVPPEPIAAVTAPKLLSRPPPVARPASSLPLAPPRVRRCAVEMHAPRVPHPELAAPGRRDGIPAPSVPRLCAPVGSGSASESTPVRRAATLTDFPVQSGDTLSPRGDGWTDAERSPMSATLRGVGG